MELNPVRNPLTNSNHSLSYKIACMHLDQLETFILVTHRILYVTDWGPNAGIIKINTDGSGFSMLVNGSIGLPNGMALDLPGNRLYWVDRTFKKIESIRSDGSGRVVVKNLPPSSHPFSISVFEDLMYWTDENSTDVYIANRFTGDDERPIMLRHGIPVGVEVMQKALQPSG